MLHDLPKSAPEKEPMLRVDLDADLSSIENLSVYDAPVFTWASSNQMHKEISPFLVKFLEKGATLEEGGKFNTKHKDGWVRLQDEMQRIFTVTQDERFQRAADLLEEKHPELLAIITSLMEQSKKDIQAFKEARTTVKLGSEQQEMPEIPYKRVLFCLDGVPLQETEEYENYRTETYERKRPGILVTCPVTGRVVHALVTSPKDFHGGKLGSNIPKGDIEASSWGYLQNSRMRMTDSTYLAKVNALTDGTVPVYMLISGKDILYIALWDVGEPERKDRALSASLALLTGQTLNEEEDHWLTRQLHSLYTPSRTDLHHYKGDSFTVEENNDLRLAIFATAKTRIHVETYESFSKSAALRNIARFRHFYGKLSIRTLLESMEAPEHSKRPLTRREVVKWLRRFLDGTPATMIEALRAVDRYLLDLKRDPKHHRTFRAISQNKIIEDYMSVLTEEQKQSPYYQLGVAVWKGANLAYQTGLESNQNDKDNAYAEDRQNTFIQRFLPLAVKSPDLAIRYMLERFTIFLRSVPKGKVKQLQRFLRMQTELVDFLTNDALTINTPMSHLDRILVWKGYADSRNAHFQAIAAYNTTEAAQVETQS